MTTEEDSKEDKESNPESETVADNVVTSEGDEASSLDINEESVKATDEGSEDKLVENDVNGTNADVENGVPSNEDKSDMQEKSDEVAKKYDFVHPSHKLNSRLPVLDLINESLAENLNSNLTTHFHQPVSVRVLSTVFEKFQDYSTDLPACINIDQFQMTPLQGSALLIVEGDLVFTFVESFFGGNISETKSTGARRFTPTEIRIIEHLRENLFAALTSSWEQTVNLQPTYQATLTNAQITSPANPGAVVVCIKLEIELKSGKGECHIVIPYSMLDPIRSQLTRNIQKNNEHGVRWKEDFVARIMESELSIRGVFAESKISVKQLVNLKVGDFIPLGTKNLVEFSANRTPLFDAKVGVSNGLVSASVVNWHQHRK